VLIGIEKNRCKCYQACLSLKKKQINEAFKLFSEIFSSFNCLEMLSLEELYLYTVCTGLLSCDREQLKEKILKCPEVFAYSDTNVPLSNFASAFYNTEYNKIFPNFLPMMFSFRCDWFLYPHCNYISKALRVKCYQQYLKPYKNMKMETMANDFGISVSLLRKELGKFIPVCFLYYFYYFLGISSSFPP